MKTAKLTWMTAILLSVTGGISGCTAAAAQPPVEVIVDEQGNEYEITSVKVPAPKEGMGTDKLIRIGIPYNYPGIGLMDEETGIPSGLDVDIAAYIAWKLGYSPYDIEWVAAPAPARVPLLQKGRVDMMVAPMTITPERAEQVDFAGPYLVAGQDILVRSNDSSISTPQDLNGRSVCLLLNTTAEKRIREMLSDDTEIVYGESYVDCMHKIVDGEIDATSTDDIILAGHASTDEFFRLVKLVGKPFSEEYFGIGLPKGSHSMCLQVNAALSEMFVDGSWEKFISRNVIGTNYFPDRYDNPPALNKCA